MYFFVGLGTVRQSPYSFAHILLQAFTPPDCDLVSICFFSAATEEKLKTKTAAIEINLREKFATYISCMRECTCIQPDADTI
jgi:hypothetical protein